VGYDVFCRRGGGARPWRDGTPEQLHRGFPTFLASIAPFVMLELPESLVKTSTAPALDAPGPIEEGRRTKRRAAAKEDTKPPEPEADVALCGAGASQPEPPAEEKQATPPTQQRAAAQLNQLAGDPCLTLISSHFKRYPSEARSRGRTRSSPRWRSRWIT